MPAAAQDAISALAAAAQHVLDKFAFAAVNAVFRAEALKVGTSYLGDKSRIGLHQADNQKLLEALLELRDLGNTLIVVEHDEDTMLSAD